MDQNDPSIKKQNEEILPEEVFWGIDENEIDENINNEGLIFNTL